MITHTPGPWVTWEDPEKKDLCIYIDAHLAPVAHVFGCDRHANSCLISAAPDLLDALQDMLDRCHDIERDDETVQAVATARAAIAKATGVKS